MASWKHIRRVIDRELRIIRYRPIYLLGSVVVMAFCTLFFLTFFQEGLPHDLPIGVVDQDGSSLSRNLIRQLDATEIAKVIKYSNFEEARADMAAGRITSVCVIPANLFADVSASRRPVFTYYLNGLYYVGGALAYKGIVTMANLVNGGVQRQVLQMQGVEGYRLMDRLQPVSVESHQIGNAFTNYGYYLTNIFLPGILELVIIIILIYSLGAELKYGTSRHLLETSGGSLLTALLGKLIVYTVLFTALGLILVFTLYHWMHFPIAGSLWNMVLAVFLLVLAAQAIAVFILGCLPVPRLALSVGALYSVLAFTFAGFTLPIEAMPPVVRGLSVLFPLRYYYLFYTQEVIFGTGFAGWWPYVCCLLAFLFLPLFILPRLKGAYVHLNFPKE